MEWMISIIFIICKYKELISFPKKLMRLKIYRLRLLTLEP